MEGHQYRSLRKRATSSEEGVINSFAYYIDYEVIISYNYAIMKAIQYRFRYI